MTKIFVGGSRGVSRLNFLVRQRLANIVERELPVVIGDANGVDKAVQRYFHEYGYRNVQVYCSGSSCRNNVGSWPQQMVQVAAGPRDAAFYTTKDRAMAREASIGFMIWDGASVGTLFNVFMLLSLGKKVVLYAIKTGGFIELRDNSDWLALMTDTDRNLREKLAKRTGSAMSIPRLEALEAQSN